MSSGLVGQVTTPTTKSELASRSPQDDSFCVAPPGSADPEDAKSRDAGAAPPVVAMAARPPVTSVDGQWRAAPGGLAPIVRHALDQRGGAWVSWTGGATPPPQRVDGVDFDVLTFNLKRREAEHFYSGYSNRTLWPLLHDMVAAPSFDPSWFAGYEAANDSFAVAAEIASARIGGNPTIWVHDYHLMLVPERLRRAGLTNPVSFFLHTPFPSPAIFARLPERSEILRGLGGADLVGFHTEGDRQRFVETWATFGYGACPETVAVAASIDPRPFAAAATDQRVRNRAAALRNRMGDRILLFGVERLDYTKGIPERLRALEVLLERRADLRRRLVYVQVAQPSRERVPEYQRLRVKVESEIGRLNGRFTQPGYDVPFRYLHRAVSQQQLLAYYLAADTALVTPLRDGMNLVAKEFVVTQAAAKGRGALVLSEFAGAAAELTDAVQCNPFDAAGTADAIETAIEMNDEDRRKRISVMAVHIENNDLVHWADQSLRLAERAR